MDDLIYRQDAIEAAKDLLKYHGQDLTEELINYFSTNAMERIPSAQPEHLQTVMKKINERYEKGMNTPCINRPMAWALYETWKEYDK